MRKMFRGSLVLASLAALTLGGTANAASVLTFGNITSTDPVVGTVVAGGTNLTTPGNASNPGSTQISITSIGGVSTIGSPPAFFTLSAVRGTGTASTTGNVVTQDTYTGTVIISSAPAGAGQNILTVNFTGGTLQFTNSTTGNGPSSGALTAANATFSSANGSVIAAMGGTSPASNGSFSISLQSNTNITTTSSPFTIAGFTATPQGGFNIGPVPVPEPASIAMASTAVLTGLGCFGIRRFKSTRA